MSYRVRFLVVDDDPNTLDVHCRLLAALGFEAEPASDGAEALAKIGVDIDLVLVDAGMPGMDGFEFVTLVRADPNHGHIPIIMVTGGGTKNELHRAYEAGVNDFLHKPLDLDQLVRRSRLLLRMKRLHDELRDTRDSLEREVDRRTEALRASLADVTAAEQAVRRAHLDTIKRLIIAAEYKDLDTASHIDRIGRFSEILARELGRSLVETETIRHAAPMHDVGKLGIPDSILLKPGPLTTDEWVVMRSHTTKGAELLAGSESPIIQMGETIALSHHEAWDGTGYPHGLAGEDIPIEGRICATVDYFDALTSNRPYRAAVPREEVIEMMAEGRGSAFDPNVFQAFLDAKAEIFAAQDKWTPRTALR